MLKVVKWCCSAARLAVLEKFTDVHRGILRILSKTLKFDCATRCHVTGRSILDGVRQLPKKLKVKLCLKVQKANIILVNFSKKLMKSNGDGKYNRRKCS